jgi:hypothetical protein
MVIAISVSTSLAAIAVGILGTLFQFERIGREHLETTQTLARLARQFRGDIAAAEFVDLPRQGELLSFELQLRLPNDRTVTYRSAPGRIVRLEKQVQAPANRERFRLPDTSQAWFTAEGDSAWRFVLLTIGEPSHVGEPTAAGQTPDSQRERKLKRAIERDGVARRGWRVEALVGRDLRHANVPVDRKRGTP